MKSRTLVLLLGALLLAVVMGCGSNNNTASNNPQPSPSPSPSPQPSPQPSPSPTPSPAATAQYEAALLRPGKTVDVPGGQIIVNAGGVSGAGKITATNGAVSATYNITFEPFTNSSNVINLGTVTSDASGNISGTFTFSQKGTFAGVFHVSAGTNSFGTEIDPMDSGVDNNTNFVFNVPLVRSSMVSPTIQDSSSTGTDPLTSGTVVSGGGKIHIELHGAAPNGTYIIGACGVNDSSSCSQLNGATITTDSSGNGTLDTNGFLFGNGDPAIVVELFRNSQRQFVSGFTVQ